MTLKEAKRIFNINGQYTEESIKKIYRNLARTYHPDYNNNGNEMMQKVNEAYEVLKKYINIQYSYDTSNKSTSNNYGYNYHRYYSANTNYSSHYYQSDIYETKIFKQKIADYYIKELNECTLFKSNTTNYTYEYLKYIDFLNNTTQITTLILNSIIKKNNNLNVNNIKKSYYDDIQKHINNDITLFYNEIKTILININDTKFLKVIDKRIEFLKIFDDTFSYSNLLNLFIDIKTTAYNKFFQELKLELKEIIKEYENYSDFDHVKILIDYIYNDYCKMLDKLNEYNIENISNLKNDFHQLFNTEILKTFDYYFTLKNRLSNDKKNSVNYLFDINKQFVIDNKKEIIYNKIREFTTLNNSQDLVNEYIKLHQLVSSNIDPNLEQEFKVFITNQNNYNFDGNKRNTF